MPTSLEVYQVTVEHVTVRDAWLARTLGGTAASRASLAYKHAGLMDALTAKHYIDLTQHDDPTDNDHAMVDLRDIPPDLAAFQAIVEKFGVVGGFQLANVTVGKLCLDAVEAGHYHSYTISGHNRFNTLASLHLVRYAHTLEEQRQAPAGDAIKSAVEVVPIGLKEVEIAEAAVSRLAQTTHWISQDPQI